MYFKICMELVGLLVLLMGPVRGAEGQDEGKMSTGDDKTDAMMVELQGLSKEAEACVAHMTTVIRVMDQVLTLEANTAFKRPNLMRIDTVQGETVVSRRLSDGGLMWNYDKEEKIATKVNLGRVYRTTKLEADGDQPDPLRPFRGLEWKTIRYQGQEPLDGKLYRVFEANPIPNMLHAQLPEPPVKVQIYVDANDGLLRISKLLDGAGNEILSLRFKNLTLNPKLEGKSFEFLIPSGAHVMDATDDLVQLFKTLGEK